MEMHHSINSVLAGWYQLPDYIMLEYLGLAHVNPNNSYKISKTH
jgi:hypothetical protein